MSFYKIARTDKEIDDVIALTIEASEAGSKFPGMTYEEGLREMFDWLTGGTDDNPMDD